MIGNQIMFVLVPLFLTLVITISAAPVIVDQLIRPETIEVNTTTINSVFYENESEESDESGDDDTVELTPFTSFDNSTSLKETDTTTVFSTNVTEITVDADRVIKTTSDSLFDDDDYRFPTIENTQPVESTTTIQ